MARSSSRPRRSARQDVGPQGACRLQGAGDPSGQRHGRELRHLPGLLEPRMASHGFLATCYESTQTGAGTQGIKAFETASRRTPTWPTSDSAPPDTRRGARRRSPCLQLAEAKYGSDDDLRGPRDAAGERLRRRSRAAARGSRSTPRSSRRCSCSAAPPTCWSRRLGKQGFDALSRLPSRRTGGRRTARRTSRRPTRGECRSRSRGSAGSCSATRRPASSSRRCQTARRGKRRRSRT